MAATRFGGPYTTIAGLTRTLPPKGRGQLQINYTYGHALDEVSNGGLGQFNSGSNLFPQDGRNLRGSYSAADYDGDRATVCITG